MVLSIGLVFYILATILFVLAGLQGAKPWFLPMGLACFAFAHVIAGVSFKAA